MNRIVVGVDIAKRVFQLHWVEPATGEIVALQLKREKFLEHFANRSNCVIGMEECGGAQHWARALQKLGHQVKLLSAWMVKPFVCGNKNDAADARAIWTAVQQAGIKVVAIKSEAAECDSGDGDDGGCESLQVGPSVCGLAWVGARAKRYRRTSAITRYQQARG